MYERSPWTLGVKEQLVDSETEWQAIEGIPDCEAKVLEGFKQEDGRRGFLCQYADYPLYKEQTWDKVKVELDPEGFVNIEDLNWDRDTGCRGRADWRDIFRDRSLMLWRQGKWTQG